MRPARRREVLAGEGDQRGASGGFKRDLPRFGCLDAVGGAEDEEVRDHSQRRDMLHRLVRRPVFADADRVVRHHVDDALTHQRAEADGGAGIVREDEEGAGIGHDAAMQRHAVHRGSHRMLADAPVDVAAAISIRRERRLRRRGARVVGAGEIG